MDPEPIAPLLQHRYGSPASSDPSSGYHTPSSTSSLPYILMPNVHPLPLQDMASSKRPRPSFPIGPRSNAPLPTTAATNSSSGSSHHPSMSPENRMLQLTNPHFAKGPQHKHAHHLHSIPPKEKTTRTLILDHMLWLHARARFAQVRAELGMNPDRAGSAEDEDEYISFGSDGECADGFEERAKDAMNARAFKARADGLEKVLSAMLDQPPEELPFDADDLLFRDTSFVLPAAPVLPNGVRLRISLAGLINDIFAEDTVTIRPDHDSVAYYPSAPPQLTAYTPSLVSLSRLSSFAHNNEIPVLPPFQALAATADPNAANNPPAQSILPPPPPAGSIFSSIPRGAGPESPWALGSSLGTRPGSTLGPLPSIRSSGGSRFPSNLDMPPPPPRVFRAVGRSRDLYNAGIYAHPGRSGAGASGASGSGSNRPPRCPHHLTYVCPPSSFCVASLNSQSPVKQSKSRTRSTIGAGLSSSGPPLRRSPLDGKYSGKDARMTDLLPRFLRLSALVAVELGREARGEEERDEAARIQAARRESFSVGGQGRARAGSSPHSLDQAVGSSDDSDEDGYTGRKGAKVNGRPTKLWYQLLAGLLTRSALQGYLVKGWKGTDAVEVLLGVGIGAIPPPTAESAPGLNGNRHRRPSNPGLSNAGYPMYDDDDEREKEDVEEEEEEKEFEPDDMPDLTEAWHILFGFSKTEAANLSNASMNSFVTNSKEALQDYERMMAERMSEFFAMPANCPDLSAHLNQLSEKCPAGPVDRAVLRFCEAVARWRGRPELETYKSRASEPPTPTIAVPSQSGGASNHARGPSRPLIERYFMLPSKADRDGPGLGLSSGPSAWDRPSHRRDSVSSTGTKRSRRSSWADGKGKKVVIGQAWMEEDEYVGPYGI